MPRPRSRCSRAENRHLPSLSSHSGRQRRISLSVGEDLAAAIFAAVMILSTKPPANHAAKACRERPFDSARGLAALSMTRTYYLRDIALIVMAALSPVASMPMPIPGFVGRYIETR